MAGIYIHVPFCSKRCTYCDFFSSTNMQNKETYVDSVVKELELRKEYLSGEGIGTIYFGGELPRNWTYGRSNVSLKQYPGCIRSMTMPKLHLKQTPTT